MSHRKLVLITNAPQDRPEVLQTHPEAPNPYTARRKTFNTEAAHITRKYAFRLRLLGEIMSKESLVRIFQCRVLCRVLRGSCNHKGLGFRV